MGASGQLYERLKESIEGAISDAQAELDTHHSKVTSTLKATTTIVANEARKRKSDAYRAPVATGEEVVREGAVLRNDQSLREARDRLLAKVRQISESRLSDFRRMAEQLEAVTWEPEGDALEQLTALQQSAEDLREQLDDELEAAQLGMTVEVISHEFGHTITDIRQLLRELNEWADRNSSLAVLLKQLRDAFHHLDAYLTLFTPLQRRLYRTSTVFTGADIASYLRRLFRQSLLDGEISLVISNQFERTEIQGYPSTYYPIFVNLLDNAIWWLKGQTNATVRLTTNAGALLVVDNGPGVLSEDRDIVFERRFSLKPGGRGLGLTISRDSIRKVGGDLRVDDTDNGATFRIILPKDALREREDEA